MCLSSYGPPDVARDCKAIPPKQVVGIETTNALDDRQELCLLWIVAVQTNDHFGARTNRGVASIRGCFWDRPNGPLATQLSRNWPKG